MSTGDNSSSYTTVVKLDTNRVFIAHQYNEVFYGIVCTVSGMTVEPGVDTPLSLVYDSYGYATATLVDTNRVFIAHENNVKLYGMVITILDETCAVESGLDYPKIEGITKTACTTTTAGNVWVLDKYY